MTSSRSGFSRNTSTATTNMGLPRCRLLTTTSAAIYGLKNNSMENFTNETIDTAQLPRFEHVPMTSLHGDYWKVTAITLLAIFGVLAVALGLAVYFVEELAG